MTVSLARAPVSMPGVADQDVSAGRGRGYSLNVDEAESLSSRPRTRLITAVAPMAYPRIHTARCCRQIRLPR